MYLSHYNLKEKPFQISTDPKYIWFGANHREALAVLEYGVIENKGFLLITGDVGTGKTTLINALLTRLGNDVIVANVTNPILEELDFFNIVANEFNFNKHFRNKGDFLQHFNWFLNDCYAKKKKVILVIDEAHKLNQDLLEQIRLFSNIERHDTKLINIFFVGQNEFIDIISDNQNRALRQRMSINFHLDPLTESEVREYICHRLNVGGLKENIFNEDSIYEIMSFTNGYPRLVNILCDHALLTGYVKGVKTIDGEIIKECANGLFLTRGNNDYRENDLKISQEALSAAKKEPAITPLKYLERHESPEKRIAYTSDNPNTLERATRKSAEDSYAKSSGKRYKYLAVAAVLLIALGVLYYPANLGGHIGSIKNYFTPVQDIQNKLPSAGIMKKTISKPKLNPVVRDSNKYDGTRLQPVDPAAESQHPPIAEKTFTIEPQKRYKIKKLPSVENFKDNKYSDKLDKSEHVSEHKLVTTQKYTINFGSDLYDFSRKNIQTLEKITEFLAQHPKTDIIIKGYTDTNGDDEYNEKLSKLRARSVKSYFVDKGINISRIRAFGMGQKNPIGSNNTREGRIQNRRVEIELFIKKT